MKAKKIKRPALRYHGGKWRLADWVISFFPRHRVYVSLFGGGGSVLLQKPRSEIEIYNELDQEITNFFEVVRDEELCNKLAKLLYLTPFSQGELENAYLPAENKVEKARRTVVRSFMGFSSSSVTAAAKSGFRGAFIKSFRSQVGEWNGIPENLLSVCDRLRGVEIRNMTAIECIENFDSPDTLFYADPPYLPETRFDNAKKKEYRHEMSKADHVKFAETIKKAKGKFIVSGYPSRLYSELYKDFYTVSKKHGGQSGNGKGTKINTEVLWISSNAKKALPLLDSVGIAI